MKFIGRFFHRKIYKNMQLKHRLNELADIEALNILRISSGVPTYEYNHITIKELEISKLHPVRKSKEQIEAFIKKEKVYPQGLFTLKMILMRE